VRANGSLDGVTDGLVEGKQWIHGRALPEVPARYPFSPAGRAF
jgi:hypothetical protein